MKFLNKFRSIRFVLTLWYSLVLLVAFVIFGSSIYVYLEHLLVSTLQDNLVAEMNWIERTLEVERRTATGGRSTATQSERIEETIQGHLTRGPRNYIVLITLEDSLIVYESENLGERRLIADTVNLGTTRFAKLSDKEYNQIYVAARRNPPFIVQVAYPERPVSIALEHVFSILILLGPIVLIFSFSGGWILSGIILRPIGQITEMTRRITAQNLNERIPPRAVSDELGNLIQTINNMIERLQGSFDQIRRFSMNVAHELKTPLTILKGESELALSRSPTAEEAQELVTTYLEETVRLSRIVDDLLTLAKADAGQMKIQHEPVRLDLLMEELLEDGLILTTNKETEVELVANEQVTIQGDEARLRQLLRNLLMNAVQFTSPGDVIRLSCKRSSDGAAVAVQDTGIGIPLELQDSIFEPFFRVDTSHRRAHGGSGLGLSIARWIVEAHHATIRVSSKLGEGSSFTIIFPHDIIVVR